MVKIVSIIIRLISNVRGLSGKLINEMLFQNIFYLFVSIDFCAFMLGENFSRILYKMANKQSELTFSSQVD